MSGLLRDHWWSRPGVEDGRRMLVWHVLLDDAPEAVELAGAFRARLAALPGLDPVPAPWLHITTQVVGFTDEITPAEAAAMTAAAARWLRGHGPVGVSLGRDLFHPEGVVLGIDPPGALDPVHRAVREAAAATVAAHRLADYTDWADWGPHLSVAYANADVPTAAVAAALAPRPQPVPLTVRAVHLVSQQRVGRLYRWDPVTSVPLTG
ncbi:2'-5' RNA ligase family protein [Actinomadura craniellae]|uniref:2'-5' RNA ligase family protein n=1 Tax=Actinomadura craniellae TaxID=2231787 RepID=A0A365HAL2_9ACTN|nr:2'-5' RNA ligase family protein [Actinomadura craniellae]RAY16121.1 2'-5' RNA ligase family protein [Actinomadura craniellae]